MRKFGGLVLLMGSLLTINGCSSEAPKRNSTLQANKINNTDSSSLCNELLKHQLANDIEFKGFVNKLCDGSTLSTLNTNAYRGSGTPYVESIDTENGTTSSAELKASFVVPVEARSYFNLMKLQIDRPSDFDDHFEGDDTVVYTRLSGNGDSTSYRYRKDDEIIVEYEATSYYIEVASGIYAITSKLSEAISLVKTFRGIQFIVDNNDGTTSVYSLADQSYDNQNDHSGMVRRAKNNFEKEIGRSYRNGKMAIKADSYFE